MSRGLSVRSHTAHSSFRKERMWVAGFRGSPAGGRLGARAEWRLLASGRQSEPRLVRSLAETPIRFVAAGQQHSGETVRGLSTHACAGICSCVCYMLMQLCTMASRLLSARAQCKRDSPFAVFSNGVMQPQLHQCRPSFGLDCFQSKVMERGG